MTKYYRIKQFARIQVAFSAGSLSGVISNEQNNGLAGSGAIIRIGRIILINDELFWKWVQSNATKLQPRVSRRFDS